MKGIKAFSKLNANKNGKGHDNFKSKKKFAKNNDINFLNFINENEDFEIRGGNEDEFNDNLKIDKILNDTSNAENNKSNNAKKIDRIINSRQKFYITNNDENKMSKGRDLIHKFEESNPINRSPNKEFPFLKNKSNEEKHNINLGNAQNQEEIKTNLNRYIKAINTKMNNEMNNNNINKENYFNLHEKNENNYIKLNINETNRNSNNYSRNQIINNEEIGNRKIDERRKKTRNNDIELFPNSENIESKIDLNTENRKNKNILHKPNYCKIFENINIFNSTLIMLINNTEIKKYCLNKEKYEKIKMCEKNRKYCLSSILYHLDKFVWDDNDKKISLNALLEKYNDFITDFITKLNTNQKEYLYDIKNIGYIIRNIYSGINSEFTQVKKKVPTINGENDLSKFKKEFVKYHNSIISDHFIGFFKKKNFCENCQKNYLMNNLEYRHTSQFYHFYFLDFDLNEVNEFIQNQNLEIKNSIINLDKCFDFLLYEKYKQNYIMCESCKSYSKSQTISILTLPNILTITLTNNDKSVFDIQDTINLNKYYSNNKGNYDYYLISMLCQNNYTGKLILYCYNCESESWNCYTDGKIKNSRKMDINAIPIVLVYQIGATADFIYESLKREEMLCLISSYGNGVSKLINFPKNCSGEHAYEIVGRYFDLPKDKICLLIKANKLDKNDILSNKANNGDRITIILRN